MTTGYSLSHNFLLQFNEIVTSIVIAHESTMHTIKTKFNDYSSLIYIQYQCVVFHDLCDALLFIQLRTFFLRSDHIIVNVLLDLLLFVDCVLIILQSDFSRLQ